MAVLFQCFVAWRTIKQSVGSTAHLLYDECLCMKEVRFRQKFLKTLFSTEKNSVLRS